MLAAAEACPSIAIRLVDRDSGRRSTRSRAMPLTSGLPPRCPSSEDNVSRDANATPLTSAAARSAPAATRSACRGRRRTALETLAIYPLGHLAPAVSLAVVYL
jgi:hypothetical protein